MVKSFIILVVASFIATTVGFGSDLIAYVFIFCLTLIILPMCLKDNTISSKVKIFTSISVGIIDLFVINLYLEKEQMIPLYVALFIIALLGTLILKIIEKNKKTK